MIQKIRHRKGITKYRFNKIVRQRQICCIAITCLCTGILSLRLIELQLFKKQEMTDKLAVFQQHRILLQMPRGKIKDCNGNIIVQNQKIYHLVYKKNTSYSMDELKASLESIAEDVLKIKDDVFVDEMFKKINYANQDSVVLYKNLDLDSVSRFYELKDSYIQFDIKTDFIRVNLPSVFESVIGHVSSGLPAESKNYLSALGYSLNSNTGKTGLEKEYESLLKGEFSTYQKDKDSYLLIKEGASGADLILSIDVNLQKEIENLLLDTLKSVKHDPLRKTMDRILLVMSNPSTGDILAGTMMIRKDEDGFISDPSGLFVNAYVPGSIVKGAALYAGLSEQAISEGQKMLDEPIYVKGTPEKSSWKNLGWINDIEALAFSSNVYLMKTAILMGHGYYQQHHSLDLDEDLFERLRNTFSAFGLGVQTGIDVPNEKLGYLGDTKLLGNVLDYVIGQYDTYTMIQLMQYINTVANGGNKITPRLVLGAQTAQGEVLFRNDVKILHRLEDLDALNRVREGFELCVKHPNGLCKVIKSKNIEIAAKTGTAQTIAVIRKDNGQTVNIPSVNNAVIAYAPANNPKVSVACMIPNAWIGSVSQKNLCLSISKKCIEIFMEMNF